MYTIFACACLYVRVCVLCISKDDILLQGASGVFFVQGSVFCGPEKVITASQTGQALVINGLASGRITRAFILLERESEFSHLFVLANFYS